MGSGSGGGTGKWLEEALVELCKRVETGLDLDREIISGLVSYCELADPLDAKDYLDNIIGEEAGRSVIEEYLQRRGHSGTGGSKPASQSPNFHAYIKPATDGASDFGNKKTFRSKDAASSSTQAEPKKKAGSSSQDSKKVEISEPSQRGTQGNSKKKKGGRLVSLAEAAKGSIVFQQGKPCSCQARRHRLIGNCLSCGKIVCEQEGEGPCSFCGVLVLKDGSTYAGLEESVLLPASEAETAAEAYARRLVDYDRNSAARTTVIDDQSDYYGVEGNTWLSQEEKELLRKKREAIEEEERAKKSRVVVTFDLVGRKVMVNQDEATELESENRILRPPDERERDINRIKPNPTVRVQPFFVDPGTIKNPVKSKQPSKSLRTGLCLDITGRVQHDNSDLKYLTLVNQMEST